MTDRQQSPLKILMTADAVGGVWTYALSLSKALQQFGVEVHLATMGPLPDEHQKKKANAIPNLTLYESSYKLEWMEAPWLEIEQASMWLLYLEQLIKPDIVHLNNYVFGELPWDEPVIVIGHSCVLSWWQQVKHQPAPAAWDVYRNRVSRGLQNADAVVSVSQFMLNQLKKYYVNFKYEQVIYNGMASKAAPSADKADIIVSMGRIWDEGKNMRTLEKAAANLSWPVLVAGDQREYAPQKSSVEWLGKLSANQIDELLEKAGLFVSSSLYEPFGLAALEAASHGCALVLSDIDTYREVWGDAACYFDTEDENSLVYIVNELIHDPNLLEEMQSRAWEKSLNYPVQNTASAYMQLYRSLVQKTNEKNTILNKHAN